MTPEINPGTVVGGTLRPEDLVPALLAELFRIDAPHAAVIEDHYRAVVADPAHEDAGDLLAALAEALDDRAPEGMRFGSLEGDGADLGWWVAEPVNYEPPEWATAEGEELDPELADYVVESDVLGSYLKHPLVFMSLSHAVFRGMANESFRAKRAAATKALADERWTSYVFLHERPYRADALAGIADQVGDDDYWPLVAAVWTDSENIHQSYEEWEALLEAERGDRSLMMDDDERARLASLPDTVTVWRGATKAGIEGHLGFSWTLDRQRAEWFARRFAGHREDPVVVEGRVGRDALLAFFGGRREDEVLALPDDVRVVGVREL